MAVGGGECQLHPQTDAAVESHVSQRTRNMGHPLLWWRTHRAWRPTGLGSILSGLTQHLRSGLLSAAPPGLHPSLAVLLGVRSKQGEAPASGGQQGAEEDDGVDAGAAFGRPVNVFEVQPEGELVEGEGCAYAVEDGHEAA